MSGFKLQAFLCVLIAIVTCETFAQDGPTLNAAQLKKMSLEELMNLEVSLVSRVPEKLNEAASAVQIITGETIRNSGATNIAEALRLVSNLQVAQLRSNAWIISSRGFNTIFANKLLVMIDGRTVYTPLFAGVLWDMQNVLLEDIDRIEVVSGPGGSLWGANAVNGVINIVTKPSSETQRFYASAGRGSFIRDQLALRWGGKVGESFTYKVYGQHYNRNSTQTSSGADFSDAWKHTQGGFRMDWKSGEKDSYTIQGDYHGGLVETKGRDSKFDGQNVLGRWTRKFNEESELKLQLYYDRYFKEDAPGMNADQMNTIDLDFQHRFPMSSKHRITWGLAYRRVRDKFVSTSSVVAILPRERNLDLINTFIQDQIKISQRASLTVGTKLLHNVYTGIEIQPTARVSVAVGKNSTAWAAISRAVRTPSRIDVDYFSPPTPPPPGSVSVMGGPGFESENLIAIESGYRIQPNRKSSISLAGFYNIYDNLYSLEALPGTLTYTVQNGTEGKSWGLEFSGLYQLSENWRLRGGYTFFDKNLKAKAGHNFDPSYLSNDAQHQALLQSMLDLPRNFHLDIISRFLDYIPASLATAKVPAYFTFDARIAYQYKIAELAVVGQNLYAKKHTEFSNLVIPRSVYVKLSFRW